METFQTTDALELSERLRFLGLAGAMANLGYWFYLVRQEKIIWSSEVYAIHGLDPETFEPSLRDAIDFYHPEDRPVVTESLKRAVAQGVGYELQLRLIRADGACRFVKSKADCERDSTGAVRAVFGFFQDVTDQVMALDEAREAARRAAVAESIVGLGHWRIEFPENAMIWSPQMYAIYGLDPSSHITPALVLDMVHPDDRDLTRSRIARDLLGEASTERPVIRIVRPDGQVRWVIGYTTVERDGQGRIQALVGTLMDITEKHQTDAALAETQMRYRLLTDNAADLVTESTLDGRLAFVSPAVETLTGYAVHEVVGRSALDFVAPEDRERVAASYLRDPNRPSGWTIEYRLRRKDGKVIWVEAHPSFVRSHLPDGPYVVLDVVRDVTARKSLEADLVAAREEALAASAVKSEFLANMSHELRTPLTSIVGFASLLVPRLAEDAESARYGARIMDAGQALLTAVNDILDFSKLEAGQVEIEPRAVCAPDLLASAVALLTPQADAKGLVLKVDTQALPTTPIMLDDGRVRQIVLNLIGNAVKFTPSGSVALVARLTGDGERIRVEVRDTGGGVPKESQDRLFRRFSQVDGSTTRIHGGTGLGLAICKGLVDAMDGRIGVESALGRGSVFWFELPLLHAEADAVFDAGADLGDLGDLGDFEGMRLLVVDDNGVNRDLVTTLGRSLGIVVSEADCGEAAISLAQHQPFDVILMDLRMPGIDGFAAARAIYESDGANATTPILAFSADVGAKGAHDASLRLFDGAVAKPISVVPFLSSLRKAVTFEAA